MPPAALLLLLLVVAVMVIVGSVAGLCPPSCTCDPGHLAVTCSNASLQVVTRTPHTLNIYPNFKFIFNFTAQFDIKFHSSSK